jgi:hypothetical protein
VAAHLGLVVHVQVGDNSTFGQDNDARSEVSNTFWCGRDGTLEQMVDTDLMAWTEEAGNGFYSSVETEGFPTEPLTIQQVTTLAGLYAWGHRVHGWPLRTCDHGEAGLTTHAHYPSGDPDPSWGGHPCPGPLRSAQLPRIVAAAARLVDAAGRLPIPSPTPTPTPALLEETEDLMPYLAICSETVAAEVATLPPPSTGYPSVAKGSVWILYPAGYRSWVGSASDTAALVATYGQKAPVELTGRTLSRIAVRPTFL